SRLGVISVSPVEELIGALARTQARKVDDWYVFTAVEMRSHRQARPCYEAFVQNTAWGSFRFGFWYSAHTRIVRSNDPSRANFKSPASRFLRRKEDRSPISSNASNSTTPDSQSLARGRDWPFLPLAFHCESRTPHRFSCVHDD